MGEPSILSIFPTPLLTVDLEDSLVFHPAVLDEVISYRASNPGLLKSNMGGGWHSPDDDTLIGRPVFAPLMKPLLTQVERYLALTGYTGRRLHLLNMWVVTSPKGASNVRHSHPYAIVSGAYYLQANDESSPLTFHDPRPTKVFSSTLEKSENPFASHHFSVRAKPGRLFLFPSWLEHEVAPNASDEERVTLSFNFGQRVI